MNVKPMLRRCGAFLTDLLLISMVYTAGINLLPEFLSGILRGGSGGGVKDGSLLYGLLTAAYFLGSDLINQGNSPGKDVLGLRTVGPDGDPPGLKASLARTLLKLVSISVLPVSMAVYFWKGRQITLQDHFAHTAVVRINHKEKPR